MAATAAAVLPSLLSLLLVMIAAGAAGAEDAMIRPAAAAGINKVVGETLCCSNMTGFHECVEACFAFYPREDAEKYCDPGCKAAYLCQTVSGDECPSASPSGHHSSPHLVATDDSAAGETLCCSNMTGFHECLEGCFGFFPPEDADKFCDPGCEEAYQCHTISGDKCPSEQYRYDSSAKRNAAVGHCILRCNSSVCNKMVTGVGRKGVVKHAVERCNNACYKFCTKQEGGVRAGKSTA